MPNVIAALEGRYIVFSAMQPDKIISIWDAVVARSSPALQQDLRQLKQDIQGGVTLSSFKVKVEKKTIW